MFVAMGLASTMPSSHLPIQYNEKPTESTRAGKRTTHGPAPALTPGCVDCLSCSPANWGCSRCAGRRRPVAPSQTHTRGGTPLPRPDTGVPADVIRECRNGRRAREVTGQASELKRRRGIGPCASSKTDSPPPIRPSKLEATGIRPGADWFSGRSRPTLTPLLEPPLWPLLATVVEEHSAGNEGITVPLAERPSEELREAKAN
mmetsp:Transcript_46804/g.124385  ORF Transcript_46804/g.124385 Transcript_46804/m.124385 type:complete len:203 (+) Transcript_46804:2050-2658(+)